MRASHAGLRSGEQPGPSGASSWTSSSTPTVVIFIRMKAKGRGSGIEIDRPDALVYRISGGLIAQIDYFNDRDEAPKAVGLEE